MAGNMSSSSRKMAAAFGKRFMNHQISSSSSSALVSRRSVHGSVYDKNVDDNINPVAVPDDIVQPQSEKYWSPNPQTGVFGPAAENNPGGERGFHTSAGNGGTESVLEQQTFFRPQEDLDKPQPA